MVNMGAVDNAADELVQLLEMTLSDISQLGSTCGDEQLITTSLHHLQACLSVSLFVCLSLCLCLSVSYWCIEVLSGMMPPDLHDISLSAASFFNELKTELFIRAYYMRS